MDARVTFVQWTMKLGSRLGSGSGLVGVVWFNGSGWGRVGVGVGDRFMQNSNAPYTGNL